LRGYLEEFFRPDRVAARIRGKPRSRAQVLNTISALEESFGTLGGAV
jgi:hypothetical protein